MCNMVNYMKRGLITAVLLSGLFFAGLLVAASVSVIGFKFSAIIGYGLVVLYIWIAFESGIRYGGERFEKYEPWVVMIVFFAFYLVVINLAPELGQRKMPFDSLRAQKSLEAGHVAFFRPTKFYYWVNYDLLLSTLGIVFSPKLIVGQVVNAICRVAALYPIFKLSERISGRRIARFVTIIAALSPALTLYSTTLVGDYISAMFYLYAFYFFITKSDHERFSVDNFVLWVVVGLLAGLGYLFKTISFLYVVAFVVWAILAILEKNRIRVALQICLAASVIGLAHGSVKALRSHVFSAACEIAKVKECGASSFTSGVLYEMWLGLCVQTGGWYSPTRDKAFRAASKEKQVEMVANMLKTDRAKYPRFMVDKFRTIWGSNDALGSVWDWFRMSCQKDCYNMRDKNYCVAWLKPLLRAEHLFLVALFLFGAGGVLCSMRRRMDFWEIGIVSTIIVVSFAVMSMLIESHSRYRVAVYPFFFLLMSYACVWFERDNPVYARLARWAGSVRSKLKRKGNEC